MDDFEAQLKAGLSAEVGAWSPTPGEVRRTTAPLPRRRLQVALAVAVVVVASLGGIGVAVGLPGGGHRAGPASLAEVPAEPSPTPSPSCVTTSVSPVPSDTGLVTTETCDVTGSAASCAVAPPVGTPCNDVTVVPTSVRALPSQPGGTLPPTCTAADLHLSLTTDASSYVQTTPVEIAVSSTSTAVCEAHEPEVSVHPITDDGRYLSQPAWTTCHGAPLSSDSTCGQSLGIVARTPGDRKASTYIWDMVVGGSPTRPKTYAPVGFISMSQRYLITYSWGSVKTTKTITVTSPPTCTAVQLTSTITADAGSYARSEVAHFKGTVQNTSDQLCAVAPYVETPSISDSTGAVIWSCGIPTGLPRSVGCRTAGVGLNAEPLLPGATLTLPTSTWTWNLVHDGTKDTDPGPVPDGTYTLDWAGVGVGSASPVALTVTG